MDIKPLILLGAVRYFDFDELRVILSQVPTGGNRMVQPASRVVE
jgi:hypothetical protein